MSRDPDTFSDDSLPPGLLADLRAMERAPAVPPGVDARMRAEARRYFARQKRVRLWVRVAGGLAAAVAIAAGVRLALEPNELAPNLVRTEPPQVAAGGPQDVDGNGVVDILDAFTVARGVEAGQAKPNWDINGDGVVDRQDADAIATLAVRVKGGVR